MGGDSSPARSGGRKERNLAHVSLKGGTKRRAKPSFFHPRTDNAVGDKHDRYNDVIDVPDRPAHRYKRHGEIDGVATYSIQPVLRERFVGGTLSAVYGCPAKKSQLRFESSVRHRDG